MSVGAGQLSRSPESDCVTSMAITVDVVVTATSSTAGKHNRERIATKRDKRLLQRADEDNTTIRRWSWPVHAGAYQLTRSIIADGD